MSGRRRTITPREVALILGVSEATLRNWVRHGYLTPAQNATKRFFYSDVLKLKKQLASGKINRLKQRANRTGMARTMIPAGYVADAALAGQAERIRKLFVARRLNLEKTMFCLAVRLLVIKNEVRLNDPARMFQVRSYIGWKRQAVKAEMVDWMNGLQPSLAKGIAGYTTLFSLLQSIADDDILGLLYQTLHREGRRSRQGMYYTPADLLAGMIDDHTNAGGRFLDPCCGTGRFMMHAGRSGCFQPEDLTGFDNDPIAARVARVNLLLSFPDREFKPRVFCLDVLDPDTIRVYRERFHLIATNPPWGAKLTPQRRRRLQKVYPSVSSGESFSFFLTAGLDLLEKGGRLSFILPEALLNIRAHRDIRAHLLSSTSLAAVAFLGRRFGGVFSPAIRIDLKKQAPSKKAITRVVLKNGRIHKVPQARFLKNDHYIIDAGLTEPEAAVIKKIYGFPHVTLAGAADWALGIVTGDNRKYLSDVRQQGMEPVYRGKDVEKYRLKRPGAFIRFEPKRFQQAAPEEKYRAKEKLIYRFVSRCPVFAFDNTGALTVNSANILIPKVEDYPLKAVLGVLNSRMYRFVFKKKFRALKVLRGDLETLPLPLLGPELLRTLAALVDRAIAGENVGDAIDELIMTGLGLSEKQRRIILEAGD